MKNVEDIYPLSPMQQGMLFETLSASVAGIYVEQLSCTLSGDLDAAAFAQAWKRVVERHAVLRTAFLWEGLEQPLQIVRQQVKLPYSSLDWRELPATEQEQRLLGYLKQDRATGFELSRAPLLRLALIRLNQKTHHFIWSYHHLLMDGWSEALIFREVLASYEALRTGTNLPQNAARPYRDYIAWLQGQDLDSARRFWQESFKGMNGPTLLLECVAPIQSGKGPDDHVERRVLLSAATTSALHTFAKANQLTLGTVLQGAWALLLSHYSGELDVTYGAVVAGRPAQLNGVEEIVGLFINTLPVRAGIADEPLSEWLRKLQEQQAAARSFEYSPLRRVQEWAGVTRGRPLFDTLFVFENYPVDPSLKFANHDLQVSNFRRRFETTNYPLTIATVPGDQLLVQVSYDQALLGPDLIDRLLGHYQSLLMGMIGSAEQLVTDVSPLTASERQQLLRTRRGASLPDERITSVQQLFEAQVDRTPDALAVKCGEQQLSYRALNDRANQLAYHLRHRGIAAETIVATFLERSITQLVAMLGILKAGGVYLPIDPATPADRINFMIRDARVQLLLTHTALANQVPGQTVPVVDLDHDGPAIEREPAANPAGTVTADNLAYVIYTSGSTGPPKGVMVSHRSLVSSTRARLDYYHEPVSSFLLLSPFAFDSSLAGIFWTICQGGSLLIPQAESAIDPAHLSDLIAQQAVTHLLAVPSLYATLWETLAPGNLRVVVVAGESCSSLLAMRHLELLPHVSLFNEYGPTEATVWASVHRCQPKTIGPVPIGRAIANTDLYLLDSHLNPTPLGLAGDLYIGGTNLARGYFDRPQLTAERFIPNPFSDAGRRLYRTGDRARFLAGGEIEFLGRADRQVKVRGYRVELGEIESVLITHPALRACAVVAQAHQTGVVRLIAFVVPVSEAQLPAAELRGFLADRLPSQMIPATFVSLSELPLTANGKIDHQILLDGSPGQITAPSFVGPRTSIEESLSRVWASVLKLDRVGIHENFFDLGGDSILALQIISRARQAGLHFTPPQLFQHPTIAGIAPLVRQPQVAREAQDLVSGPVPLTPIQHWFFEHHSGHPHHYHQSVLLEIQRPLSLDLLKQSITHLLTHHDALRMRFTKGDSGWQQMGTTTIDAAEVFSSIDLSQGPESGPGNALAATLEQLHTRINIYSGPLLQVAHIYLGRDAPDCLFIAVHHLVIDAVSFRILIEDLEATLRQLHNNECLLLPPKTASFKQWAEHLTVAARSAGNERELEYWLSQPWQKVGPLILDKRAGPDQKGSSTISVSLSSEETRILLQEALAAYHTQIDVVLLAALSQTFSGRTRSPVLLIDLEGHGRESLDADLDLSRTVGWFTTIFPVLLDLRPSVSTGAAIRSTKDQWQRLPRRGIGYGLLRYLRAAEPGASGLQQLPRAQVSFNYLGQLDQLFTSESWFLPVRETKTQTCEESPARPYLLEINSFVLNGQLQVSWTYSKDAYREETIEQMATKFITVLRTILDERHSAGNEAYTPADFPLVELDGQQLAGVIAKVSRARK